MLKTCRPKERRYRYTEWDGGKAGIELYAHQTDPGELHDLAAEPGQEQTLQELRKLLDRVRKPATKAELQGDFTDPEG
jgi:hypothetical protein